MMPVLYERWLKELLPGRVPEETRATCASCVQLPGPETEPGQLTFRPEIKCCTYHPDLANFRVGQLLADPELLPSVRETLLGRLASHGRVTPLGLATPTLYQFTYDHSIGSGTVFGRAQGLRCPYYQGESGQCGIWRHREAVCSTWFCRYERGLRSRRFWERLKLLLRHVDRQLSFWCLVELLPTEQVAQAMFNDGPAGRLDEHALDSTCDPGLYRLLWGSWEGREAAFYAECAKLVAPLGWARVVELGGVKAQILAALTRQSCYELADGALPALATPGKGLLQISRKPGTVLARSTVIPYDSRALPGAALTALPRLRGPLAEALAALAQDGVTLDEATVRTLFDYEVLVG